MRKGFDSAIVLDKRGEIFAIATGSDACAEHECGSKALQQALCEGQADADHAERLLIDALRKGETVAYPALLSRKIISRNLDKLQYVEGVDKAGTPVAVFGYSPYSTLKVDDRELSTFREEGVSGAWDERSFAIRVVGQKMVNKLKQFAERMQAGEGVFAGTFLKDGAKQRLGGVIIALHTKLRPEHRQEVAKAQAEWEATVRLKAKSRLEELYAVYREHCKPRGAVALPGYLWPVWVNNEVDGDVAYALNPDYGVDAPYWGPYAYDDLKAWILAEKKFPLRPLREQKAA